MDKLHWEVIGKDDEGELVLKNQFGCIWNCGIGTREDGICCGECSMEVPCFHLCITKENDNK